MASIVRLWAALASLGSALIVLAVGAAAPLPLAVLLIAIGAGQAVLGVLAARTARPRVLALAATMLLAPILIWIGASAFGLEAAITALATGPMLGVSTLAVVGCAALAIQARLMLRTDVDGSTPHRAAPAWLTVVAAVAAAGIVSGVTTPALAGTYAGQFAQPHGEHSLLPDDAGEHHH